MREIKFRAWDLRNNKWFHQDLFIMTNAGFYPDFREFDDGQSLWDHEFELMQYTGLKDHKGNEIYENDIFKFTSVDSGIVTYFNGEWSVVNMYKGKKIARKEFDLPLNIAISSGSVVGNIFENEELLEAKNK